MTSRSTSSMAEPINSTVTVDAAHGIFSPLLISNTRQSLRKSIIRLFELFDFVKEFLRVVELTHEADVADVGDLVQRAQFRHDAIHDFPARDVFAAPLGGEISSNPIDHLIHLFAINGKVVANPLETGAEPFFGEVFHALAVFADDA